MSPLGATWLPAKPANVLQVILEYVLCWGIWCKGTARKTPRAQEPVPTENLEGPELPLLPPPTSWLSRDSWGGGQRHVALLPLCASCVPMVISGGQPGHLSKCGLQPSPPLCHGGLPQVPLAKAGRLCLALRSRCSVPEGTRRRPGIGQRAGRDRHSPSVPPSCSLAWDVPAGRGSGVRQSR